MLIALLYKYALGTVCVVVGIVALVVGIIMLIRYFRAPSVQTRIMLLLALVLGAIGIYLIAHPDAFLSVIAVIFGIYIVYNAIIDMQSAVTMKKAGYVYWYVALIISLVTLALGVVLILLKSLAADIVALTTGIMLIIQGAMNIWVAVKVKKFDE